MKNTLNPQEIYLLERYVSVEYFCQLRDTWEKMVAHVESCLQEFMRKLPKDYRSRQLPEQPDIVWGQRVLPNFRDTLHGLHTGFILLTHGDYTGLSHAWGPLSDFKGQMEFWSGWMSTVDENYYGELLNRSVMLADNICRTETAGWNPQSLANYCDQWGPLDPPARWPDYKINVSVSVVSGDKLERSGIYVPDLENSCAEFLSTDYDEAPAAKVLVRMEPVLDPTTGEKYDEQRIFEETRCTWYLVERDAEAQAYSTESNIRSSETTRLVAGEICPETAFYFTPAKPDSPKLFKQGDVLPDLESEYGRTIWQRANDVA